MYDEGEVFREIAQLLRVRPELKDICRFGAQWAQDHAAEKQGWAPFHIVTLGGCLLDVGDRTGVLLKAGDAAILPHGSAHTVRALPTARGPLTALRVRRRLYDELVVKSNVDGEPDTKIICGRLCFEHAHNNMVLGALPPIIVLSATEGQHRVRLGRIVDAIRDELEEERLGGAAIAAALASSLMIIALTAHFENEETSKGILALLAQRQTARALTAMLSDLARNWKLDELADKAKTSRSTLVRLFQRSVDAAPLAFLSDLRLSVARNRVLATKMPLSVIADQVGYKSETAFNRAYRRSFGIAPGTDRKNAASGGTQRRPRT
jgi:AraC family transcriptional regulator, activator of mtrCDE